MRGDPSLLPRRAAILVAAMLMAIAAYGANTFKPKNRLADSKQKIELSQQVPESFGDWREEVGGVQVLPDPTVQAKLDFLYSSVLSRTYINSKAGGRIMLTIAYGSDQSSEATAVHRPEFCYTAQGFRVNSAGLSTLKLAGHDLAVQQLIGVQGKRREQIIYWITIDEKSTLPGIGRKLEQIRYGLKGQIPDGLLFRISSISNDDAASFRLQGQFLSDLANSMNQSILSRYFGNQSL